MNLEAGLVVRARSREARADCYSLNATLEAYEVQELNPRQVALLLAEQRRDTAAAGHGSRYPGEAG